MTPIPFEVSTGESDNGVRVVKVRGELDMHTAPELESQLRVATSSRRETVLINLKDCEFIDSTGMALIVQAWQRLDQTDGEGRLVLCCATDQVKRLLDITGVESSIAVHDTMDEALDALAAD